MAAWTKAEDHHHAHHFTTHDEEFAACKEGMWVFLLTEVLFFSGLFVAYAVFKGLYPEMFMAAHKFLDWRLGATNTVILILSSLTMALCITSIQKGQVAKSKKLLLTTLILSSGFLVVKYFEYSHKFHIGVMPGHYFTHEIIKEFPNIPIFFSLYFVMTGLHGLHVIIGMGVMVWLYRRMARGEFGANYYTPVEVTGLYWHFVDMVWIYLFPLLYLVS